MHGNTVQGRDIRKLRRQSYHDKVVDCTIEVTLHPSFLSWEAQEAGRRPAGRRIAPGRHPFAAVQRDRLIERRGPAVVQIRRGIDDALRGCQAFPN